MACQQSEDASPSPSLSTHQNRNTSTEKATGSVQQCAELRGRRQCGAARSCLWQAPVTTECSGTVYRSVPTAKGAALNSAFAVKAHKTTVHPCGMLPVRLRPPEICSGPIRYRNTEQKVFFCALPASVARARAAPRSGYHVRRKGSAAQRRKREGNTESARMPDHQSQVQCELGAVARARHACRKHSKEEELVFTA